MANFLTTAGCTSTLEAIIKQAKKRLILISPYLQINPRIRNLIEEKDREIQTKVESRLSRAISAFRQKDSTKKMKIQIVYRKDEVKAAESGWLQALQSIETIALENLHAKCYLNEDHALVTSMNLLQSSQVHNYEMGVLVSRGAWGDGDGELYNKVVKHAEELIQYGEEVKLTAEPAISSTKSPVSTKSVAVASPSPKRSSRRRSKTATPTLERPSTGYCIRCGGPMPKAIESKPFCAKDWRSWNRFKNDDYQEKFCHFCGQASETSKAKPLCLACFRKYKPILEL